MLYKSSLKEVVMYWLWVLLVVTIGPLIAVKADLWFNPWVSNILETLSWKEVLFSRHFETFLFLQNKIIWLIVNLVAGLVFGLYYHFKYFR